MGFFPQDHTTLNLWTLFTAIHLGGKPPSFTQSAIKCCSTRLIPYVRHNSGTGTPFSGSFKILIISASLPCILLILNFPSSLRVLKSLLAFATLFGGGDYHPAIYQEDRGGRYIRGACHVVLFAI